MSGAVRVRELTFGYPDSPTAVLDHLTLDVDAGERVAVLGPNGSGKTTLIRHLVGLLHPHAGSIAVDGVPVER